MIRGLGVLVILFSAHVAFAAPMGEVYRYVYSRCRQTRGNGGIVSTPRVILKSLDIQTMADGFGQSLMVATADPIAIASIIEGNGLSPRLAMMLNHSEFVDALTECYGENQLLKTTFVTGLILSDISGKVAAGAVVVGSGFLLSKVATALVRAYPLVRYALFSVSLTAAVSQAVYIRRELTREATDEEKAAFEKTVNDPMARGDDLVRETELMLAREITRLNQVLPTLPESEREPVKHKVDRLSAHLTKLRSLDPNPRKLP